MRRPLLLLMIAAVAAALPVSVAAIGSTAARPVPTSAAAATCDPLTPLDRTIERDQRRVDRRLFGREKVAKRARARAAARAAACRRERAASTRVADGTLHRAHATGSPTTVGQWGAAFAMNGVGIHATLMPNGKVLKFYANPAYGDGPARAVVWDPVSGGQRRVDPPSNIWCAGQTLLADGRVMIAGGNLAYEKPGVHTFKGLDEIWLFDPRDESWTRGPDMLRGRWYPTTTRMADGRVLITAGWDETGRISPYPARNQDVEVYTPAPDGRGPGTVARVATKDMVYYPHWFVLPDSRLLMVSPRNYESAILDPATWRFTDIPDAAVSREYGYGSATLLPGGPNGSWRVMLMGGSDARSASGVNGSTASTEVFDAATPSAGWSPRAPLTEPRRNVNTVILPDGDLLAVGGNGSGASGSPRFETLLYDPSANRFTRMASQSQPRGYHSTALLLPDARVMSAGDDTAAGGGPYTDLAEIYSPPYLFRGPRPTIAGAPSAIGWGDGFTIRASGDAVRAVLIAPGSTTHANDMNQRHVELAVTRTAGGLTATAPPSAGVAPPGPYMLFVLNGDGVPSVARWVDVGAQTLPEAPPGEPPGEPAPGTPAGPGTPPGGTTGQPGTPSRVAPAVVRLRPAGARALPRAVRLRVASTANKRAALRLNLTAPRRSAPAVARRLMLARAGRVGVATLTTRTPARWTTLRRTLRVRVQTPGGPTRIITRTVLLTRTTSGVTMRLRPAR